MTSIDLYTTRSHRDTQPGLLVRESPPTVRGGSLHQEHDDLDKGRSVAAVSPRPTGVTNVESGTQPCCPREAVLKRSLSEPKTLRRLARLQVA
jgi:hypothetical protein